MISFETNRFQIVFPGPGFTLQLSQLRQSEALCKEIRSSQGGRRPEGTFFKILSSWLPCVPNMAFLTNVLSHVVVMTSHHSSICWMLNFYTQCVLVDLCYFQIYFNISNFAHFLISLFHIFRSNLWSTCCLLPTLEMFQLWGGKKKRLH